MPEPLSFTRILDRPPARSSYDSSTVTRVASASSAFQISSANAGTGLARVCRATKSSRTATETCSLPAMVHLSSRPCALGSPRRQPATIFRSGYLENSLEQFREEEGQQIVLRAAPCIALAAGLDLMPGALGLGAPLAVQGFRDRGIVSHELFLRSTCLAGKRFVLRKDCQLPSPGIGLECCVRPQPVFDDQVG